jgi:hypothetical protein
MLPGTSAVVVSDDLMFSGKQQANSRRQSHGSNHSSHHCRRHFRSYRCHHRRPPQEDVVATQTHLAEWLNGACGDGLRSGRVFVVRQD